MKVNIIIISALLIFISCDNKKKSSSSDTIISTVIEKGGLKVSEVYSLSFSTAKLKINSPERNTAILDTNVVEFSFDISNYDLGEQTADLDEKLCANSPEGQHIHLILNNEPYAAHYDSEFTKELEKGDYVALAFLSRSYHESLKNKSAYKLWEFSVGKDFESQIDVNGSHLFYSRPKSTYIGEDTKRILLDFYLVNVDLSPDGFKVKAEVNGISFILNKWVPYIIEGLPMGETKIKLSLLDEEGHLVKSPYNPVERTIVLEE
jgi:hypothetical protein